MKTITEALIEVSNQLKKKITYIDIAKVLGYTKQYVSQIKNDILTPEQLKKIEEYYNIDLTTSGNQSNDCITIDHIHINASCGSGTVVLTEADVTPVKIGREIIKNIWNSKPEDLKIFKASGDSMQETITDNDLLLIDLSKTNYNNGGIFLLTINNDWYIKRLRLRITGELDIISDNNKYPIETLTPDTAKELKVIGRVIKNLSKGL